MMATLKNPPSKEVLALDVTKLPTEILLMIFGKLSPADLKNARLSFRTFAAAGRPFSATKIYITETEESFLRLLDISNQDKV